MASMSLSYPELIRASLGDYGASVIASGATATTGNFWCVRVISAAVFASGTVWNGVTEPFSTTSFPANHEVMGDFTSVGLTSGTALAYKYK